MWQLLEEKCNWSCEFSLEKCTFLQEFYSCKKRSTREKTEHVWMVQIRLFKQFWATIVIFTIDVLSHMLRFSVAMVLFMCLFSNPHCTGYNYVKFIALSGRSPLTPVHYHVGRTDGEMDTTWGYISRHIIWQHRRHIFKCRTNIWKLECCFD